MKLFIILSLFIASCTASLNYPLSTLSLIASTATPHTYVVPQHNVEFYVPLASNFTVDLLPFLKCKLNNRILLTFIINENKPAYFPPYDYLWPETNITYVCGTNGKYSFESTSDPQHVPGALVLFASSLVLQSYDNLQELRNPYNLGANKGVALYFITCAVSYYQFTRQDLNHLTDNSLVNQIAFFEKYPTPYMVSRILQYLQCFTYLASSQDPAPCIERTNLNLWGADATYEVFGYANFSTGPSIAAYQLLGDFSIGDSFEIIGLFEMLFYPEGPRMMAKLLQRTLLPHNFDFIIPGIGPANIIQNKYAFEVEISKHGVIHYYQSFINFLEFIELSAPALIQTPSRNASDICNMIMNACTSNIILTQYQAGSGFPTSGAGQYPNQYSISAGLNLVGGEQYASFDSCLAYLNTLPALSPPTNPNGGADLQCISWHASIAQGIPGMPGTGAPNLHCIHTGQINLGPTVTPCQNF